MLSPIEKIHGVSLHEAYQALLDFVAPTSQAIRCVIIRCDQTGCRRVRLSPHPSLDWVPKFKKSFLAMDRQDLHAIRANLALGACILCTQSFLLKYIMTLSESTSADLDYTASDHDGESGSDTIFSSGQISFEIRHRSTHGRDATIQIVDYAVSYRVLDECSAPSPSLRQEQGNFWNFGTSDCCLTSWIAHPSILARACTFGGLPHCFWRFRSFPIPPLSLLEWLHRMIQDIHGFVEFVRSAILGLIMTMVGSFNADCVCKNFASNTLLMPAPAVVTLTVLAALEVIYASKMHC